MLSFIKKEIQKTQAILLSIEEDGTLLQKIEDAVRCCIGALRAGNKILFAGNGGSASDAQHLAAELVGRLSYHRPGIAAISLATDTSALTAIGNDYSFEEIFSRQVSAIGQKGDVLIGISTSGKSKNILKALETARSVGMSTIGLTGKTTPLLTDHCDFVLNVPASETSKIQECHIVLGHIICCLIEEDLYGLQYNPQHKATLSA